LLADDCSEGSSNESVGRKEMSNEEVFEMKCNEARKALIALWNGYRTWWDEEASSLRRLENEDEEEFVKRITWLAWANGADKAVVNYLDGEK
jgi:hypothetical protein